MVVFSRGRGANGRMGEWVEGSISFVDCGLVVRGGVCFEFFY